MKPKKVLYPTVEAEMARRGETQTYVAWLLGTTVSNINNKLAGRTAWTIGDVETLCEHYKMEYSKLFKKNKIGGK